MEKRNNIIKNSYLSIRMSRLDVAIQLAHDRDRIKK